MLVVVLALAAAVQPDFYGSRAGEVPEKADPVMFVYNLSRTGCDLPGPSGPSTINAESERRLEETLRRAVRVTSDPEEATFFFVPACLTMVLWSTKRSKRTATWRWPSSNGRDARRRAAFEEEVIKAMRGLPYWDRHKGADHLISHIKCPTTTASSWSFAFPRLWGNPAGRFACLETDAKRSRFEGNASLPRAAYRDVKRELQLPHYVAPSEVAEVLSTARRSTDLFFVGSFCCGRKWLKPLLHETEYVAIDREAPFKAAASHDLTTPRARFFLHVHGDSPERKASMQAIAAGTPLMFLDPLTPPLRLHDWKDLGVEAFRGLDRNKLEEDASNGRVSRDAKRLANITPVKEALQTYDDAFLRRFERRREVLLWHTPAFNDRLRRVLAAIFDLPSSRRSSREQQQ
ncbi:hypothetical protein CTAYLR_001817 [Chrysophaeum taylorii]|uniref:Exostosin GT47 domain-containing protein n=1 Tax=Chrysophaeum taylorii TaxID=2483200 RepID=A0AAD7XL42_9STRA|nr:hypothetical protein CTAYLR_001817 [Chrysophaeum taylorii]